MNNTESASPSQELQCGTTNVVAAIAEQQLLPMQLPLVVGEIKFYPRFRRRKTPRNLQIVEQHVAGVARKEIAARHGISPQRVSAIVRGRRR